MRKIANELVCKCDACGLVCAASSLNVACRLHERLDYPVGDPRCVMPAGECQKCGSLAYALPEEDQFKREVIAQALLLATTCNTRDARRLQRAWQAMAGGLYATASTLLRHLAGEGSTSWHDGCTLLATELDARNR